MASNYDYQGDYMACDDCDGEMMWCTCCEVYTKTCCVDYGTCYCS